MVRTKRYADVEDTDAEFELTRIRVRPPEALDAADPAARYSSSLDDWAVPEYDWAPANDDPEEAPIDLRRAGRVRRVAWRVVGALTIVGAFLGVAMVEGKTDARNAIVQWMTLGHPDQARHAEQRVRQWVHGVWSH
jgi:hypothetical protein